MSESFQQVIQDSLDSMRSNCNTPGNSFYLPTWLQQNNWDPYGENLGATWSFQMTGADMASAAGDICGDIGTADPGICANFYIGDPAQPTTLTLGGEAKGSLIVKGFSNAVLTELQTQNGDVPMNIAVTVTFSTLPQGLKTPTIAGNFSLLQYCCCSSATNQNVCEVGGTSAKYVGSGTFASVITGSCTANITVVLTKLADQCLDMVVKTIKLSVPLDAGGAPNIETTVDITSFSSNMPLKAQQSYDNLAQKAFNSGEARIQILSQVNAVMNEPGQLSAIGTALTKIIDQFLQANNKYPFQHASLSLY